MKLAVFLVVLAAAGFFAWKFRETQQAKEIVEARLDEVSQQLADTTKELHALKGVSVTEGKVRPAFR